jgi:hypothetical protein
MEMPITPDPEQIVACAIHCCDNKEYPLVKRDGDKECQRLGSKKHSCVTHQLRNKKDGRLTQTNRYPGIQAAPRFPGVGGMDRVLIPDVMVGNHVIDCKFPCDPAKVKNTPPNIAQPSISGSGTSMLTAKERDDYPQIPGNPTVEAMTPDDAAGKKGDCKCENLQ